MTVGSLIEESAYDDSALAPRAAHQLAQQFSSADGLRLSLEARILAQRRGGQHARHLHGDLDVRQKPGGLEKWIASQKSPATIASTTQKETHCTAPTRRTPHHSRCLCSASVSLGSSSAMPSTLQSMP